MRFLVLLDLAALLVVSFFVALVVFWLLIPALKFFKVGQKIREEGPKEHGYKSGTPTMGGVGILLSVCVLILVFINIDLKPQLLALFLLFIAFGLIGFADDLVKFLRRSNQGLFGWQKFWLQVWVALIFSLWLLSLGQFESSPAYLKLFFFNAGWLYLFFLVFVIVGSANATNLTDGLDGLLAGCVAVAFLVLGFLCLRDANMDLAFILVIVAGVLLGFLRYNFHPARVFMGDVGSLALGALFGGVAVLAHREFWLLLIGLPFVLETLSVMVQVAAFKLFKRRVFKMTPLHHHFELMGFSEKNIVYGFWLFAVICGLLGIWLA